MPSNWPIVTTPVPPTPVTTTPKVPRDFIGGNVGSGNEGISPATDALPFFSLPPSTVTKLGQKPLTHE